MKVLVSGFEPFDGATSNPSWEVARLLAQSSAELVGAQVVPVRLPVTFDGAWPALEAAVRAHDPQVVVALGLAQGSDRVRLERVAINVLDARIPDNEGVAPVDVPVVEGGPVAYWTGLPVKAALADVRTEGIPVGISSTAGTYVCNATFYALMHHCATARGVRAGFVHVPGVDAVPLADQVRAVATVVRLAMAGVPEPLLSGGSEH